MTRDEIIKYLNRLRIGRSASGKDDKPTQALDIAIKLLEQEPCEKQEIYEKAYKEGYDKGWSDGNFIGANKYKAESEED